MLFKICAIFCLLGSLLYSDVSKEFIAGQNQFAFSLFKKVSKTDKNLCYSPYSISNALMLCYLGAGGQTKQELGMLFSLADQTSDILVDKIIAIQNQLKPSVTTANLVAIDANFTPLKSYLDDVKALDAKVYSVNTKKAEETVQSINSWVKEKTQGYISNLLTPQDISSLTKLVLVNAVYLKAEWVSPFEKERTQDDFFYSSTGEKQPVKLMHKKENLLLYQDKDVSVVFKDLKPKIQAAIILPETNDGNTLIQKSLSNELLERYKESASKKFVELFFPRCSVKNRIELKDSLMRLGVQSAFLQGADFSAIYPSNQLVLQKVIHEAFMRFDEAGLVAAAATAATIGLTSVRQDPDEMITVRCDRPFYVVISEKETNLVLFVGYIAKV